MAIKKIKTITIINKTGIFKIECFSFHKCASLIKDIWEVDGKYQVFGEILSVE